VVDRGCTPAVSDDPDPPESPRRGFTVIELVVVILIIIVLAAILLPVPGGLPHRSAGRAMCASNLLSIGAALAMYAVDHEDLCPPSPTWAVALRPRLRSSGQFVCPKAPKLPLGYIYGAHVPLRPLHEFTHPEAVLAFWEGDPGVRTFAFRHNGVLNVGYADGHARGLTSEKLYGALLEGYGRTVQETDDRRR